MLSAAVRGGTLLTYATARSFVSARPLLDGLSFSSPAIVYNGAMMVDPDSGQVLARKLLDVDVAAILMRWSMEHGMRPFAVGWDGQREVLSHGPPSNAAQRRWLGRRSNDSRLRLDGAAVILPQMIQLLWIDRLDVLAPLIDWVRATIASLVATSVMEEIYDPGCHVFEVYAPGATKRDMLVDLARRVAVPLSAVTVIGDSHNDLPMFEVAGHRVAVANAHPDVIAAADEVAASNDDDGVARYLARSFT